MKVQLVLFALVASAKAGGVPFQVPPPSDPEPGQQLVDSIDLSQSKTPLVTPGEPEVPAEAQAAAPADSPRSIVDSALLPNSLVVSSLSPRERRTPRWLASAWEVVSDQRFLVGAAGIMFGFALARAAAQVGGTELDPSVGQELWQQCLSTFEGLSAEMLSQLMRSYDPSTQSIDVQPVIDMCVNEQLLGPAGGDSPAGLLAECSLHVQQFFMAALRACQGGQH